MHRVCPEEQVEITKQLKAHAEGFYLIHLGKTLANRIRERCLARSTLGFNVTASRLKRKTFTEIGIPTCLCLSSMLALGFCYGLDFP